MITVCGEVLVLPILLVSAGRALLVSVGRLVTPVQGMVMVSKFMILAVSHVCADGVTQIAIFPAY